MLTMTRVKRQWVVGEKDTGHAAPTSWATLGASGNRDWGPWVKSRQCLRALHYPTLLSGMSQDRVGVSLLVVRCNSITFQILFPSE